MAIAKQLLMFQRIIVPSSFRPIDRLGLLDPEGEGTMMLQNIWELLAH
jgi:hypothetical protein